MIWPFKSKRRSSAARMSRPLWNLTASEWRQTDALVSEAATVLRDVRVQRMLATVEAESPSHFELAPDAPLALRAGLQCRIEGYNLALRTFLSLGTREESEPEVIEDYGAGNQPEPETQA